jgi:multiple sugar transport system permease protein
MQLSALTPLKKKTRGSRPLSKLALQEERAAYLFLLPWILGFSIFLLFPILASIFISLTKWNLLNPPVWVGLENYQTMFRDRDFYNSMGVTLKYIVISVPLYLVTALLLSLALNQKLKGMYWFRSVMFMPSVIAGTAVAVMFAMLLNPDAGVIALHRYRQSAPLAGQCPVGRTGCGPDGSVGYRGWNDYLPGRAAEYSTSPV